jgi:hypothetical protein
MSPAPRPRSVENPSLSRAPLEDADRAGASSRRERGCLILALNGRSRMFRPAPLPPPADRGRHVVGRDSVPRRAS